MGQNGTAQMLRVLQTALVRPDLRDEGKRSRRKVDKGVESWGAEVALTCLGSRNKVKRVSRPRTLDSTSAHMLAFLFHC